MRLQQSRHLLSCTLLAASLLLSACGFQLRGTGVDNMSLDALHVSAQDTHSPIRQQVLDALRSSGVAVRSSAPYQLQLLNESQFRRAVSSGSRSAPAEYELRRELVFQITNRAGQPLLGPETLTAQRAYVGDRDNLVASSEEEAMLQQEMRQDLTRQLMFRLSRISADDLAERNRGLGHPVD